MPEWTDEHQQTLIRLWNSGETASAVAAALNKMGYPASRSTVIGRVHRLRLTMTMRSREVPPPARIELSKKPEGCRFIPGTPAGLGTIWCDKPNVLGSAYCPEHRALTTRPRGTQEYS